MNSIKKVWSGIKTNPKTVREFGFILAGVLCFLPLVANLLGMLFAKKSFHYWMGWPLLGICAFTVNLFLPSLMAIIYQVAMFISYGISFVVMRVILGILFYLVFSPLSIIMRLAGKDLLDQKIDPLASSYWKKKPPKPLREQYERLF